MRMDKGKRKEAMNQMKGTRDWKEKMREVVE